MVDHDEPVPASAYMLADHLDAALAAGEDILAAGQGCRAGDGDADSGLAERLRSSVELIRALELVLVTRVLKAREWSQTLTRVDDRFKMIASLFMSGTHPLVDALAEFADSTDADFASGDGVTAYFRSRGVVDPEAAGLPRDGRVLGSEAFLVTGRIELGALLDLVASYLDALEVHFLLFSSEPQGADEVAFQQGDQQDLRGSTPAHG